MTIVVGHSLDRRSGGALHLATLMARSAGDDLRVVCVLPAAWPAGVGKIDAEYRAYIQDQANAALENARASIPADVNASFTSVEARSVPAGLLEVVAETEATYVVAGSSSSGAFGHVALGTVTDRLLHSSPVPVALAPRGFKARAGARVTRITAAYGGSESAAALALAAGEVAARVSAQLRLASFAVYPTPPATIAIGTEARTGILEEWEREVSGYAEQTLADVRALPDAPDVAESVIGRGTGWSEALDDVDWADGDVLVLGSSSAGPLARVFLGSRAAKIIRHAPVPVIVAPRSSISDN